MSGQIPSLNQAVNSSDNTDNSQSSKQSSAYRASAGANKRTNITPAEDLNTSVKKVTNVQKKSSHSDEVRTLKVKAQNLTAKQRREEQKRLDQAVNKKSDKSNKTDTQTVSANTATEINTDALSRNVVSYDAMADVFGDGIKAAEINMLTQKNIYKEIDPKLSQQFLKNIVNNKIRAPEWTSGKINWGKVRKGTMIYFRYSPKTEGIPYDETPVVLVLAKSKNYMLGVNFHFIEDIRYRTKIMDSIIDANIKYKVVKTVKNGKVLKEKKPVLKYPLEYNYHDIVKKFKRLKREVKINGVKKERVTYEGLRRCIRLYIKKNISDTLILIPPAALSTFVRLGLRRFHSASMNTKVKQTSNAKSASTENSKHTNVNRVRSASVSNKKK